MIKLEALLAYTLNNISSLNSLKCSLVFLRVEKMIGVYSRISMARAPLEPYTYIFETGVVRANEC